MTKNRRSRIVWQLYESQCPQLAASLTVRQRSKPEAELRGSLNGFQLSNPHRQVMARLLRRDFQGKSPEAVRRAVDIEFKASGLSIDPGERDRLAQLLLEGKLRRP